jgi:hypothetical protein
MRYQFDIRRKSLHNRMNFVMRAVEKVLNALSCDPAMPEISRPLAGKLQEIVHKIYNYPNENDNAFR